MCFKETSAKMENKRQNIHTENTYTTKPIQTHFSQITVHLQTNIIDGFNLKLSQMLCYGSCKIRLPSLLFSFQQYFYHVSNIYKSLF